MVVIRNSSQDVKFRRLNFNRLLSPEAAVVRSNYLAVCGPLAPSKITACTRWATCRRVLEC